MYYFFPFCLCRIVLILGYLSVLIYWNEYIRHSYWVVPWTKFSFQLLSDSWKLRATLKEVYIHINMNYLYTDFSVSVITKHFGIDPSQGQTKAEPGIQYRSRIPPTPLLVTLKWGQKGRINIGAFSLCTWWIWTGSCVSGLATSERQRPRFGVWKLPENAYSL